MMGDDISVPIRGVRGSALVQAGPSPNPQPPSDGRRCPNPASRHMGNTTTSMLRQETDTPAPASGRRYIPPQATFGRCGTTPMWQRPMIEAGSIPLMILWQH
jgi:hypothetical protein